MSYKTLLFDSVQRRVDTAKGDFPAGKVQQRFRYWNSVGLVAEAHDSQQHHQFHFSQVAFCHFFQDSE